MAWCISLWVDGEAVRRQRRQEETGILGRLAKLWAESEGSADKPAPERNPLREQLGLDEVRIEEPPKEKMWYEAGIDAWLSWLGMQ